MRPLFLDVRRQTLDFKMLFFSQRCKQLFKNITMKPNRVANKTLLHTSEKLGLFDSRFLGRRKKGDSVTYLLTILARILTEHCRTPLNPLPLRPIRMSLRGGRRCTFYMS